MSRQKLMEELMKQMSKGEAKVIADMILKEAEEDLLGIFNLDQYLQQLIIEERIIKSLLRAYQMGTINERDRIMNRSNEYDR